MVITWADSGNSFFDLAYGNFVVLGAALSYSIYIVLFKTLVSDESKLDCFMFFGYLGLFIFLTCWPMQLILQFIPSVPWLEKEKIDSFTSLMQNEHNILVSLIATGIVVAFYNLLLGIATLFTSPLLTNISLALQIPLSIVSDIIINGKHFSVYYLVGAAIILIGFLLMVVADDVLDIIVRDAMKKEEHTRSLLVQACTICFCVIYQRKKLEKSITIDEGNENGKVEQELRTTS